MKMQLLKYIWFKIKKIYSFMYNSQDDPQLAALKQEYFGKEYQWTRPINNEEVGDVVRVTDVKKRENMYLLVFSSGSPINISLVSQHLTPFNVKEPLFINSKTPGFPPLNQQQNRQFPMAAAPIDQGSALPPAIFSMFESHEMTINLPINMKLPEISLIKAMYNNAADKNSFLLEFAAYMKTEMTTEIIKNAIASLMGEQLPPQPPVVLTPIIDESENKKTE